jgi:excisionase family DNA binding protein
MKNPHLGNGGHHNHTNSLMYFCKALAIAVVPTYPPSELIDPTRNASSPYGTRRARERTMMQKQALLSPRQFVARLEHKLTLKNIYKLLEQGTIKSIRVGKRYRIPEGEIKDFVVRELGESK